MLINKDVHGGVSRLFMGAMPLFTGPNARKTQ